MYGNLAQDLTRRVVYCIYHMQDNGRCFPFLPSVTSPILITKPQFKQSIYRQEMGSATEFRWHSQLLSAREIAKNPTNCAWGVFAPSVLFARNVNRITDGQTSFFRAALTHLGMGGCYCWCCCLPFYVAPFREKLRRKRNLPSDPFSDFHTHLFFHPCAICQEERELDFTNSVAVRGPKKPTIDRQPEDTKKHLEEMHQIMER